MINCLIFLKIAINQLSTSFHFLFRELFLWVREADEESAAETISVYDVRQSWDLSGNLEDVIRRYILELSEDEVSNITEAMNRHIPEKKIKDCLTLPPEKLCLMLQFYMKQAN